MTEQQKADCRGATRLALELIRAALEEGANELEAAMTAQAVLSASIISVNAMELE